MEDNIINYDMRTLYARKESGWLDETRVIFLGGVMDNEISKCMQAEIASMPVVRLEEIHSMLKTYICFKHVCVSFECTEFYIDSETRTLMPVRLLIYADGSEVMHDFLTRNSIVVA